MLFISKGKTVSSSTGSRSASFDELFVRFPLVVGPFLSVLAGAGAEVESALSVLESDLEVGLLSKRDISDSSWADELTVLLAAKASQLELATKADQSATQVALSSKSDKENNYTRTQIHQIFETAEASAAALLTKRDVLDSYSAAELDGFLAAKASQLELDTEASQSATQIALSF